MFHKLYGLFFVKTPSFVGVHLLINMNIKAKFTVATEQSLDILVKLTRQLAIEKFSMLLDPQVMENYITQYFNAKALVVELNSMSNQWLVVYVDDQPVGYAQITSKGKRTSYLEEKRAIRIANFGILKQYNLPEVCDVLFQKCLSVCRSYEVIWIHEYIQSPWIELFENNGFSRKKETYQLDELPLTSLYLMT